MRISRVLIVIAHVPDLYWYPHEDAWSKHRDHWCTSTLQISLLILGSRSLLSYLEKGDRYVNSFAQIWRDLNQITMKRERILLLFFSLFSLLRSDHHQIWMLDEGEKIRRGIGMKRCGKKETFSYLTHTTSLFFFYFCHTTPYPSCPKGDKIKSYQNR